MRRLSPLIRGLWSLPFFAIASVPAAAAPTITEFWLVDADTDTYLFKLEDYDSLRLPMLPPNLSIVAEANMETDSVLMEIDHNPSSTENHAPYALRGDSSGDFNPAPELGAPGWITVSATAYSGPDLTGNAGAELDLHLYLHQPDFVVRSAADIGDYDPGDGWCSIGKPPKVIDLITAVASAQGLSKWENDLRMRELEQYQQVVNKRSSDAARSYQKEGTTASLRLKQFGQRSDGGSRDYRFQESSVEHIEVNDLDLAFDWANRGLFDIDIDKLIPLWLPPTTCTLRAAVEEANALSGKQSIILDSAVGPFVLTHGDIDITESVNIIGYGQRAVIDAGTLSRLFDVNGDQITGMSRLELANGNPGPAQRGGGMWIGDDAHVQMNDSVVRDSQANFGGGIYVQDGGYLTLRNSAIRDNIAGTPEDGIRGGGVTQRGGGISNIAGTVKIYNSAIFDNLAVRGGGLSNAGGLMRIENSSVIDNESLAIGGGIENQKSSGVKGQLHLSFATVAHNQAGTSYVPPDSHRVGGGVFNAGQAYIASSILAENSDGWSAGDPLHAPDCHSPNQYDFKSYRDNIVGVLNGNCSLTDYSWGNTAWIDHGSEWAPLDPRLQNKFVQGHLAYRGIKFDSPAIDGGASQSASLYPCAETDALGNDRPYGSGCDIGAIERQW